MPGPTIAIHTLREPAQSKSTSTLHKKLSMQKNARKMLRTNIGYHSGDHTLCEPAQSICIWTFHQNHFVQELTRKMPGPTIATHTLCEPAQSKCTWTLHKREFTSKMLQTKIGDHTFVRACAVEMHLDIAQSFDAIIYT